MCKLKELGGCLHVTVKYVGKPDVQNQGLCISDLSLISILAEQ